MTEATAIHGQLIHHGRPLRVALFSGNYNCVRDGANQALNRLVAHLLRRGAEVRVYSPTAPRAAFAPQGELVPVPSLPIPGRSEYRLALGLPRSVRANLDSFAPHIVHLSAPDLLGWQAQDYARERGIPVVTSLHTRFETYLDYYRLGWLARRVRRRLDRFYRDSDIVLAPTVPIAESLKTDGFGAGSIDSEVRIWGRGVDREAFSPARRSEEWRRSHGYAEDDMVVLFFGRLVMEKGLDVFARAIGETRRRGRAIRPLIVGDGPARGWLAERLPNVNFTGHLSGIGLSIAIASADILLNPSVTEAFGNVNLEAMAAGLAIVSAKVASAASLIADGVSGLLVGATDIQGYADGIETLIDDPTLRGSIADAARAASAQHQWGSTLDAVIDAYAAALAGAFVR